MRACMQRVLDRRPYACQVMLSVQLPMRFIIHRASLLFFAASFGVASTDLYKTARRAHHDKCNFSFLLSTLPICFSQLQAKPHAAYLFIVTIVVIAFTCFIQRISPYYRSNSKCIQIQPNVREHSQLKTENGNKSQLLS